MSCSGASSWDGAAAGAGTPPGAVLQPKKVRAASVSRITVAKSVFISIPPVRSDISDSRFEQNHTLEFQNKNEGETLVHRFPLALLRSAATRSSRLRLEYQDCSILLVISGG